MKTDQPKNDPKWREQSGVRQPQIRDVQAGSQQGSQASNVADINKRNGQQRRVSERTGRFRSQTSNTSTVRDFVRPELNKGSNRLRSIRPMPNQQFDTSSTFTMPKPKRKPLKERLTRHGRAKVYRLKGYTSVAGVRRIHFREEKRYRKIKRLIALVVVLILFILLLIWNPFPWLIEFFRAVKL